MSNLDGIITRPVNIESDLGYVLSTGSGDVGTNCEATSVNPWALYKPVAVPGFGPIARDALLHLGLGNASRVEGPPYAESISEFLAFYAESNTLFGKPANGWRWLYPRGLATYNEPYRVYDFLRYNAGSGVSNSNGYNHNARNPFGRFRCSEKVTSYYGRLFATNVPILLADQDVPDTDITIGSGYSGNTNAGDINKYLSATNQMAYYGVLLVPPSGSDAAYKLICNTDYKVFDAMTYRGHENLTLEEFNLTPTLFATEGTYTAYPFLTNYAFPSVKYIPIHRTDVGTKFNNLDLPNLRLFPLAGSVPQSVIIYADEISIIVHATNGRSFGNGYSTNVFFEVKNSGSDSVTIPEFMLKIRGSRSYEESRVTGEVFYDKNFMYDDTGTPHSYGDPPLASMLGTSITVPANGTVRVPSTDNALVSSDSSNFTVIHIGCTVNTRTHSGSTIVRVPAVNE